MFRLIEAQNGGVVLIWGPACGSTLSEEGHTQAASQMGAGGAVPGVRYLRALRWRPRHWCPRPAGRGLLGLRKDHWTLRLPQGPRHSAQGDHADQPQFTEGGATSQGWGRRGGLGETRAPRGDQSPSGRAGVGLTHAVWVGWSGRDQSPSGRAGWGSPAQSGLGRQRRGLPSWQTQSWQSVLTRCPGQ